MLVASSERIRVSWLVPKLPDVPGHHPISMDWETANPQGYEGAATRDEETAEGLMRIW